MSACSSYERLFCKVSEIATQDCSTKETSRNFTPLQDVRSLYNADRAIQYMAKLVISNRLCRLGGVLCLRSFVQQTKVI